MTLRVAIIAGGGSNLASLDFALQRLGQSGVVTTDADVIRSADRVILPGVGAAADAMQRLQGSGLDTLIPTLTQPVLGICLGMQLMFEGSDEDSATCLGIMPGIARRFDATPDRSVPHMGWNRIEQLRECSLLAGIPDGTHFYFVHSYALPVNPCTIAQADYGGPFAAIVEQSNFFATQFHPERSGTFGARILENFLRG